VIAFADHFSSHAAAYAAHRPRLAETWGEPASFRTIRWPLTILPGRN